MTHTALARRVVESTSGLASAPFSWLRPVWQTSLVNPDFAEYARLCGGEGFSVRTADELGRIDIASNHTARTQQAQMQPDRCRAGTAVKGK